MNRLQSSHHFPAALLLHFPRYRRGLVCDHDHWSDLGCGHGCGHGSGHDCGHGCDPVPVNDRDPAHVNDRDCDLSVNFIPHFKLLGWFECPVYPKYECALKLCLEQAHFLVVEDRFGVVFLLIILLAKRFAILVNLEIVTVIEFGSVPRDG